MNQIEYFQKRGWTPRYTKTFLFYLSMIFLIIGGLHTFGIALFNVCFFDMMLGSWAVIPYTLIGLSALWVMFDRDTYLPFLGPAHIPCGALSPREPKDANVSIRIQVQPNKTVLYWASEPANDSLKDIPSWKDAYLNYENTGVVVSDSQGKAVLRVRTPQRYQVPFKGLLEPHVHYRVCEESGWMGRVMTVPIKGVPSVEPFSGPESEYAAMWV